MPTEKTAWRVADVLKNISSIEEYTANLTKNEFSENAMIRDAVERCLERFAEAARKLGGAFDDRFSDQINLHDIRQFGSVMRHDYDVIDINIIWNVIKVDLPKLKAVFQVLQQEHPVAEKTIDPDFDPF